MARRIGILSALAVKHVAARGLHTDGNGLSLQVARGGSRSWIFRFRHAGRRRHLGLGGFPAVSLAEARERAAAARAMLQAGKDPVAERQGQRIASMLADARAMTLKACSGAYIAAHAAGLKPKSSRQWTQSLASHVFPIIGAMPVQAVDTAAVMQVLTPLWSTKTETASRVRGRIEAILDWAKVAGHRDGENPARWDGHLDHLLPAKAKVVQVAHLKAMPYAELPAFLTRLRAQNDIASRALEFAILVAARTGEVLGATWAEFDLGSRLWVIPGERMKMRKIHRVPLAPTSLALLGTLPGPHSGLVFPGTKVGKPLANTALLDALRRAGGDGVTVHGCRSAFRDWAGDRTEFARDVVEASLAHSVGDQTERAYRRGDALAKRSKLMEAWAAYLADEVVPAAEVIELPRRHA
jgi:integrase